MYGHFPWCVLIPVFIIICIPLFIHLLGQVLNWVAWLVPESNAVIMWNFKKVSMTFFQPCNECITDVLHVIQVERAMNILKMHVFPWQLMVCLRNSEWSYVNSTSLPSRKPDFTLFFLPNCDIDHTVYFVKLIVLFSRLIEICSWCSFVNNLLEFITMVDELIFP